MTLFHLITSTPPEDASDRNARESTLRRSECPEDLVEFIVCLLEPEERGRPTTAREARALLFAQALKVQLEGEVTEGLEASSRLLELEEPPREEDELYREVRRMLMPDFFGRAHAISGIAGAGSDFNITNAKGIFLFIVGLFSVVVPFYQLAYYGWVRRKYRGLLEEGSYTRGKVLAVHLPLKHNYGCWIDYAYARDGEIYTGRVNVQSASRSGLVAGGQVGVLYDNANPKRSVIIFYDAAWGL